MHPIASALEKAIAMKIDMTVLNRLRLARRQAASLDALQAEADRLRKNAEPLAAAMLYAQVAEADPKRSGLLLQRGHCLKDIARYQEALTAYRDAGAVGAENRAEAEIQAGHLFKISGNVRAARRSYERAGYWAHPEAAQEIIGCCGMEPFRQTGLRPAADDTLIAGPATQVLRLIARAEAALGDAARLHAVGFELIALGRADLARPVFELAFLWGGGFKQGLQTQSRIAMQTGLWSEAAPLPADTAPLPTAPVRLLELVAARLLPDAMAGTERPAPGDAGAPLLADGLLPEPVAASGAWHEPATLIARLLRLTADAGDVLESLSRGYAGKSPFYAFAQDPAQLDQSVDRLLRNSLQRFADSRAVLLGLAANPGALLALSLRLGCVLDRETRAAGSVPLFQPGAALRDQPDPFDRALAGQPGADPTALAVMVAHTLGAEQTAGLAEHLARRGAFAAARLVSRDLLARSEVAEGLERLGFALKESGEIEGALAIQRRLAQLRPRDTNTLRELAIREKIAGNFDRAVAAYRSCMALEPDNEFDVRELLAILPEVVSTEDIITEFVGGPWERLLLELPRYRLRLQPEAAPVGGGADTVPFHELATELAPEFMVVPDRTPDREMIEVRQIGWARRRDAHGELPVLHGIEAVRVVCCSHLPITSLRVRIDGRTVVRLPAEGIPVDGEMPDLVKYVFNAWIDAGKLSHGVHEMQLFFEELRGGYRSHSLVFLADPTEAVGGAASNDAVVVLPAEADPAASLDERVNRSPSVIRPAARSFFGAAPRKVLVIRADQMGDFVTSVPAILRLRELLPDTELHALVTPSNTALAGGLGVFAKVLPVELAYDHATRRRRLPISRQVALRRLLQAEAYDIAIDLSPGAESRSLLRLTGAPHLVGFHPQHFPWLTFGIGAITRDPVNGKERGSHALLVRSLVEAFGAALHHQWTTVPAPNAPREALGAFGLGADDRFIVIHSGARLEIKRWPLGHYLDLVALILARTALKVVLLTDDAQGAEQALARGLDPERLAVRGGAVAPEALEALMAHCSVFVGNDTGPKHLAALRGAPTVSLHMGQVNWDEWGQEGKGFIVSRRAPCVGCGIEDVEDCGKALACLTHIQPAEVFSAVERLLTM
jgi:ADP-heptose:LPS heptosyltransferase/tetratricopeptide (TPR) repeat protein